MFKPPSSIMAIGVLSSLFRRTDERTAKKLYFIGALPILVGIAGGYYDLTYHALNAVDSFFQPAHLVIYSGIFGALIIGVITAIKTGFKSLMIGAAVILASGYGDLQFHSAFGFDSFISPPHLALISAGIITAGIMFRKLVQVDSKAGSAVALGTLWLAISYLLLAFSYVSGRGSDTSYYVIAPQPVVFMVTAFFFPALSVLVARLASLARVKMLYPALIFSISISIAGVLANPYLTYTLPLLLAGSLIPAIIYDKKPNLGSIILGASWILTYSPYAYKLIVYSVAGEISGIDSTYALIPALALYYPLMVCCGIISSIVVDRLLTKRRTERLAILHNVKASSQPAAAS